MLEKYPKEVKLALKNYPLPMHPFARKAAAAALAANKQEKYWQMSKKLFENTQNLSDDRIQGIAKELGLDMEKFNRDLNDASIQNMINSEVMEGQNAAIQGTPSIFINGKALKNRGPNEFEELIKSELQKKKK